ncbi:hypothetical protein [Streptacidiphilus sp. EB103A]
MSGAGSGPARALVALVGALRSGPPVWTAALQEFLDATDADQEP